MICFTFKLLQLKRYAVQFHPRGFLPTPAGSPFPGRGSSPDGTPRRFEFPSAPTVRFTAHHLPTTREAPVVIPPQTGTRFLLILIRGLPPTGSPTITLEPHCGSAELEDATNYRCTFTSGVCEGFSPEKKGLEPLDTLLCRGLAGLHFNQFSHFSFIFNMKLIYIIIPLIKVIVNDINE